MTHDRVRDAFLARQYAEGVALAAASDILTLLPLDGAPPDRYLAEFRCKGVTGNGAGSIEVTDSAWMVGIWFPSDYLRRAEPWQVLTWLGRRDVYHPNISDKAPVICVGRLVPGTSLVDLLYQVFEVITFKKVTMREDDALNARACAWARVNQHRFPIDPRPLRRGPRFEVRGPRSEADTP